jgi:hypothetical protein
MCGLENFQRLTTLTTEYAPIIVPDSEDSASNGSELGCGAGVGGSHPISDVEVENEDGDDDGKARCRPT